MKINKLNCILVVIIMVAACAHPLETAPASTIANAYNQFGWRVFQEAVKEKPDENVSISPYSLAQALAMVTYGAAGQTRSELSQAIFAQDTLPTSSVLSFHREQMRSHAGAVLKNANAVIVDESASITPDYSALLKDAFHAEIGAMPFANPQTVQRINAWVAENTDNKIPTLLNALPTNAAVVLLNAVYFKADWQQPFSKAHTQQGMFTLANGQLVETPLMQQKKMLAYLATEQAQLATLPYKGGSHAMTIILPAVGQDVAAFVQRITAQQLTAWQVAMQRTEVQLTLPRLSIQADTNVENLLPALGVLRAFDSNKAEFPVFRAQNKIVIGSIVHKVALDMDEQGTEAAAATGVMMVTRAMPDVAYMTVDRPFIFVLQELTTGQILFLGAVHNPA